MPRARLNPLAYAHAIRELQHGPSTDADIAAASGLSARTARDFLAALERVGAVHVASWDADAGGHARVAVWVLGPGRSVPAPIGVSGLHHRARRLAAAHSCDKAIALAALRAGDGDVIWAAARLTRQGYAAGDVEPISVSALYHRARKLVAVYGCDVVVAIAALRAHDAHVGKAAADLVRHGFVAGA